MNKDIEQDRIQLNNSETTKFINNTEPIAITFNVGGSGGSLYLKDNKMHFKGDLDISAQVLFKQVCTMWNKEFK